MPDERVRLGPDGRRARRRRRPDAHRACPRTPTSSCSTPARCARRRRSACSTTWAACARSRPASPTSIIGVGGCVAWQEGAGIVRRAPYVDVVFGPQTLHRLPQLHRARGARPAGRRSTSAFPRSRSSTTCRRRASKARPRSCRSWKAAASTARSASCPYTRGEEVSRPFDDVLTEVADLADQGVMEVTLLGQNVNAYRGADGQTSGEIADFATLLEYVAEIPGIERIRYTTSHPQGDDAAAHRRARHASTSSCRSCTCRCSRARTACSRR